MSAPLPGRLRAPCLLLPHGAVPAHPLHGLGTAPGEQGAASEPLASTTQLAFSFRSDLRVRVTAKNSKAALTYVKTLTAPCPLLQESRTFRAGLAGGTGARHQPLPAPAPACADRAAEAVPGTSELPRPLAGCHSAPVPSAVKNKPGEPAARGSRGRRDRGGPAAPARCSFGGDPRPARSATAAARLLLRCVVRLSRSQTQQGESLRLCLHCFNKRLIFKALNVHKNKNLSQVTPASMSLPLTICLEKENKSEHKEQNILE